MFLFDLVRWRGCWLGTYLGIYINLAIALFLISNKQTNQRKGVRQGVGYAGSEVKRGKEHKEKAWNIWGAARNLLPYVSVFLKTGVILEAKITF